MFSARPTGIALASVLVAMLIHSADSQAQEAVRSCRLLSLAEVEAVGAKVPGPLSDDESVLIKKGTLPEIPLDLRLDQCTSQIGAGGMVPYRLTIAHAKEPMDKRGWQSLLKALDKDEKPSANSTSEPVKVGQTDCEYLSWQTRRKNTRIFELGCFGYKGNRQIGISFSAFERSQLPTPQKIGPLLEKVLSRL